MLFVRGGLSIVMVVVGATIIVKMLHYPLAESFTGLVLGGAMILLGTIRLRQVREAMRR